MSSVSLAVLAFLCPLAGATVGMTLRSRLPQHHLARESTDVIKLATGLVATLVALVLSLLISSANSSRVSVENEYKAALADVIQLDRYLAAYGPQVGGGAREAARCVCRDLQPALARRGFRRARPGFDGRSQPVCRDRAAHPGAGAGRCRAEVVPVAGVAAHPHGVADPPPGISQEASAAPPWPVLWVVVACSAAIFCSFGLFVPPNTTVVFAFVVAALRCPPPCF